jgi:iron complex outermembrane receptor protein
LRHGRAELRRPGGCAGGPTTPAETPASPTTSNAPTNSELPGGRQTDTGNTIAEVVVTAERRDESLQDVSVAVSAYTSEARELTGITTTQDISNFTPGLQYSSQLDRISLRGIGRLTNVLAADPGVAAYVDGIYTSSTVASGRSTLFVDRVEVLRGPQGTLYGRNSIGGAINTISRRPTDDWYAEVRGGYANYDRYQVEGAVSGPLAEGLQFRLAGNKIEQREGYFDNVVEGLPDEGETISTTYVEAQLQFQLGENFDGWAKIGYTEANNPGGGPGARASFTPGPYNTLTNGPATIIFNGGFGCNTTVGITNRTFAPGASCVNPATADPRKFAADTTTTVDGQVLDLAGEFIYHLPSADLKYLVGAAKTNYQLVSDLDGTGLQGFNLPGPTVPGVGAIPGVRLFPQYFFNYQQNNELVSHEVTLSSTNDSPLQYIVGAYVYRENYEQPVFTELRGQPQVRTPVYLVPNTAPPPPGFPVPVPILLTPAAPLNPDFRIFDSRPDFKNETNAIFGQIDYAITEQFKLTAGLRYSEDRKSGTEQLRVVCFAVNACSGTAPIELAVLPSLAGLPAPLPFLFTGPLPLALDLTRTPSVVSAPATTAQLAPGVASLTTYDPATGFASRDYDASFEAVSGTLGLEFTPDDDSLFYAKYSRGFKAGGFRTGVDILFSPTPLTQEETVDAYEGGMKKQFLEGRLQANAAVFFYKYQNLQIPLTVINTSGGLAASNAVLFNVPESESRGFELETIFQPIDNLQFIFNYGYLDTEVTEGVAIDPADPAALDRAAKPLALPAACVVTATDAVLAAAGCTRDVYTVGVPNGGLQRAQNLEGNSLPNSPKNKFAISANYTIETGIGSFIPSVSYIWRDEQFGSIFQTESRRAPSWDQIDARLTFNDINDKFSVILYGRNLADELGYESGAGASRNAGTISNLFAGQAPVNQVQGVASTYFITPPRTFGIELQYKFF